MRGWGRRRRDPVRATARTRSAFPSLHRATGPRIRCHNCRKGNRSNIPMPGEWEGLELCSRALIVAPAATQRSFSQDSCHMASDLRDEAMGPGKSCLFFLMDCSLYLTGHPLNFISHGDMVPGPAKLRHPRCSRVLPSSPRKTEGKVTTPLKRGSGTALSHFPSVPNNRIRSPRLDASSR